MTTSGFHEAYLGKRLQDFLTLSHAQMIKVYRERGLVIPVEGSSTLQALAPGKARALADLSRALAQPHQLIAQRIEKLHKLELVQGRPDPTDGRRTEYVLTARGEEQWHLLNALMDDAVEINRALFREIECDLLAGLERAMEALEAHGFDTRFAKAEVAA